MSLDLKTSEKETLLHLHGLVCGLHRATLTMRPLQFDSQVRARQWWQHVKKHGLPTPSADRNQQRSILRLAEQGLVEIGGTTKGQLVKLTIPGLLYAESFLECPPKRFKKCFSMLLRNATSGLFTVRGSNTTAVYGFRKWDCLFTTLELLGAVRCTFGEVEGLYTVEVLDQSPDFMQEEIVHKQGNTTDNFLIHETAIKLGELMTIKPSPKDGRNEIGLFLGRVNFISVKAENDCRESKGIFDITF